MKIAKSLNRLVSLCVIAVHLVVSSLLVVGPSYAQGGNADGTPLIELEVVETGIAGDSQVFSATIIDNDPVLDVEFFYRFDSFAEFRQIPMTVIPGTSFYTATVELLDRKPGFIEYYVNVRDSDNNKVTKGFAFDPLVRVLESVGSPITSAESTATPAANSAPPVVPAATGRSTGRTILYVGLAVLAVGVLAAAASAGGSGSSDGSPTTPGGPTIPVTITVDTVASGF